MPAELDISEARKQFNSLDEIMRSQDRKVIHIMRHSRPAFAVVDVEYLDALLETLDVLSDPAATAMLQDSIADLRNNRLHEHEDVKREFL